MATTIRWYAGDGSPEILPAASGGLNTLGFFGSNFGFSIRVGEYNNTSFRTNQNGTSNGGALPNLRYANVSGAYVAGELTATELREVDNDETTLKITLVTDNAIQTQNASLRAFDRVDIDNNPSGVTIRAAEVRKFLTGDRGSGNTNWSTIAGSGSTLSLYDQITADFTTHDFFIALSATPTSIGEKTNIGFYFETEFL